MLWSFVKPPARLLEGTPARKRQRPPQGIRLGVERLEVRAVPASVVSVINVQDAYSGGTNGVFRFERTGDTSGPLTVNYALGGTASPGVDYLPLSGTVSIPAGAASVDVPLMPVVDNLNDPGEAAAVTLVPSAGYSIGASPSATVNILDGNTKLTFALSGGGVGAVSYDVPWDAVNAGAPSQSLPLANFDLHLGGVDLHQGTPGANFTTAPTAQFQNGKLVGISFGIDASALSGFAYTSVSMAGFDATVQPNGSSPYSVTANDVGNTELTFAVNGGGVGAVSYDVPWDAVNASAPSQSLPLANFDLRLGGVDLNQATPGARFTTAPTAQFQYGQLVGVTFGIDTSAVGGYAYTSVSMAGFNATVQPNVGLWYVAAASKQKASLTVDFSTYVSSPFDHTLTIKYKLVDGTTSTESIKVKADAKPATVLAQVDSVFEDLGLVTKAYNNNQLTVKGTAKSQLASLSFTVVDPPRLWVGPSFGGANSSDDVTPKLYVNGVRQTKPG